ncbi:hypothetical protein E3N88_07366 [Mikania micrantha]|uniref:Uncharacterized protein n=1 Tax=Mikania micrantha TaxID=192012 RepID=A0A5N6PTQ9_9ASTR|nr:hypothetical protein E3N88_07366 [Mikania micrantha]
MAELLHPLPHHGHLIVNLHPPLLPLMAAELEATTGGGGGAGRGEMAGKDDNALTQRKTSRIIQRSLTIVNCSVLIRILQRQECTIFPGFRHHKPGYRNQLLGYRNQHFTSRSVLLGVFDEIQESLKWSKPEFATRRYWMQMPNTAVLIANAFGVIVVFISLGTSVTIFPLWTSPEFLLPHRVVSFVFVNDNPFVMFELNGDYPMPTPTWYWSRFKSQDAATWEMWYRPRLDSYTNWLESRRQPPGFVDLDNVHDLSGRVDRLEWMMRWMMERMAASAGMDVSVYPGPGHDQDPGGHA